LFDSFFRAAYLEEGLKFIIIYFFCTKLPEFNEKYDALIYSASVGLGYAGMENIGYLYIEGAKFSERIYPLFLHLGLALIMGIFLMKSIFNKFNKKLCIFLSLLLPILIHGFHNFIISTGTNLTLLLWIILIALNFLFIIFMIFYSRSIQTKKIIEDEIKYEISDAEAIKSYFYVFFIISVIILFGYLF
jgi:RsiW-degrading membrane proteinase PrsW (M82 family)